MPRTSLHIVFIAAIIALLHFLTLCLLPFWCGGLCAAHGIRRTARRCPGVSDQCVGYTAGNTCRIYLRGGPGNPHSSIFSLLLGPCWPYFSLLGTSWAHFALPAAFVVALGRFLCVLGRSGLDFGRVWAAPGMVLEIPKSYFSRILRANMAALHGRSDPYKTLAGATKTKVFTYQDLPAQAEKTVRT